MDKALSHIFGACVDDFNFLRCHIFALGQFENVLKYKLFIFLIFIHYLFNLFPIDDLQRALSSPAANIASVQPPLLVKCFFGQVRHFVVSLENIRSSDANFANIVLRKVIQLRDIDKFDGIAWSRNTNMAGCKKNLLLIFTK